MRPKQHVTSLPVYEPGKPMEAVKKQYNLNQVVKLASNENPFHFSKNVKEAIKEELDLFYLYPDGSGIAITEALAKHYNVQSNQIILGAGSDEIILMLCRAYLEQGDETIMVTPTFPQYKHNATIENAVCIEIPLVDGKHDLQAMADRITDKTKIVWVCNPNNPTGTIVTNEELSHFMKQVPENVLVVLDEAYIEYVEDPNFPDGLDYLKQYSNVIVLRTFSKIYGLASLRIGYGIASPSIIELVNRVREPFNTTRMGQVAAVAALQDQDFVKNCRQWNNEGIQYIEQQVAKLGLTNYPANGNFVMIETNRPADQVFEQLLRRGVIIRGGHKLGYPTKIRVTVGTKQQNEQFIAALEEVLKVVEVLA